MNDIRKKQVHAYLSRYFGLIKEFTVSEPQIHEFVPELFKFPYSFQIFECSDGYLVAAYYGVLADNFLYSESAESVTQAITKLPNVIMGTQNHLVFNLDGWGGHGLIQLALDYVQTPEGPKPTTGWKLLFVASLDWEWPMGDAETLARAQIDEIKARVALYESTKDPTLKSYNHSLERPGLLKRLNQLVTEYQSIITEVNYKERVIHAFINSHPILFFPTKKRLLYEHLLKEDRKVTYKIDFIIEQTTGRYILVELENPKRKIFQTKGDFSQWVSHAEQQVENWFRWIRDHYDEIKIDLPGIIAPEGMVIIGRSSDLSTSQRDKIRIRNEKHAIKLLTYDDLSEEAENHIKTLLKA